MCQSILQLRLLILAQALLCAVRDGHCAAADVTASFDIGGPGHPLPHLWSRCLGSGHAALTLREDWRNQVGVARGTDRMFAMFRTDAQFAKDMY